MYFVNKMCFKITLAMLCFFFFLFKLQLQQPKLKEVFAWHSIVFLLCYLADHQNCIDRTAILCHILYVIYFGNLGYGFSLVIPKL